MLCHGWIAFLERLKAIETQEEGKAKHRKLVKKNKSAKSFWNRFFYLQKPRAFVLDDSWMRTKNGRVIGGLRTILRKRWSEWSERERAKIGVGRERESRGMLHLDHD